MLVHIKSCKILRCKNRDGHTIDGKTIGKQRSKNFHTRRFTQQNNEKKIIWKNYNTVKLSTTHRDCIYLESNNNVMKCTVCRLLWWSFCCWVGSRARCRWWRFRCSHFSFPPCVGHTSSALHSPSVPFRSVPPAYSVIVWYVVWTIYLPIHVCIYVCVCVHAYVSEFVHVCPCLACDAMTSLQRGPLRHLCVCVCAARLKESNLFSIFVPSSDWMIVGVFLWKKGGNQKPNTAKTTVRATWSFVEYTWEMKLKNRKKQQTNCGG